MFFSNPWQEPAKHYDCGMSGTPQTFWTEKHKRWCCYKFRGDVWGPALYEHGFAENVGEKQPKSHGNKISISITIKIAIGGYAVCTIFRQKPPRDVPGFRDWVVLQHRSALLSFVRLLPFFGIHLSPCASTAPKPSSTRTSITQW